MPTLLNTKELRTSLQMEYEDDVLKKSYEKRAQNIKNFLEINRENLKHGSREKRLCLYTTLLNEKIYIQYPGKESEAKNKFPKDFRPKLIMSNGDMMQDASFGFIWDIFESIGKRHNEYLTFVAALLIQMQYLYKYKLVEEEYNYSEILTDSADEEITKGTVVLKWNKLNISDDVWFTLNDRIGMIEIPNGTISFEAFIKFFDLLIQNEDCKYYYKETIINKKENKWITTGRPNTVSSNLRILQYLENKEKLSDLLNAIQKGRGVMSFKKSDYSIVTDGIVINTKKSD